MDTYELVSKYFLYALPILGVVALIVLIVVLSRMAGTIKKLNPTVTGVNEAVETTNGYLKELGTTVKTVNNLAMSVEAVRATTERVVRKTAKTASREFKQVKGWVNDFMEAHTKKPEKIVEVPAEDNKGKEA